MNESLDSPDADLASLLREVQSLRATVRKAQQQCLADWKPHLHQRGFKPSAANLGAYIGLRRQDIRDLQSRLADLGMSSLGRCEGHVLGTLDAVIQGLRLMLGEAVPPGGMSRVASAMKRESLLLRQHTNHLLGQPHTHRHTRFMVTLPSECGTDYQLVRDMLLRGMDCARINFSHDDIWVWEQMADNVRRASKETGRRCKILMDLAGPKLRTGSISPAPPVLHLRPKHDAEGKLLQPAQVILDGSGAPGRPGRRDELGNALPPRLAVDAAWVAALKPGDEVHFRDLRGSRRVLLIQAPAGSAEVLALCDKGAYIAPGTVLEYQPRTKARHAKRTSSGAYAAAPAEIRLCRGDSLLLTPAATPGEPAQLDAAGRVVAPAQVSCAVPEVFAHLRAGQRVWIDDGRIGALIESVGPDGALLHITHARPQGERLLPEKGLNFPDSILDLPALTPKDLADLDFAVAQADIVGYSFVKDAEDMDQLVDALAQRGGEELGIIAKIETRQAFANLPEIVIHGAGRHPFGVMIARGDLAVETGYEHLAEKQEEILWLCEAAHVPVVWATQVLESMVKEGRPSRAEMTDAAMAGRAECIMLNKGPYILDALSVLDKVVVGMQSHQLKKTAQFRPLRW